MVWVRRIGIGVAAVVLLAVIALYGASQIVISRTYTVALAPFHAASTPVAIAEGERVAGIAQCLGCHGETGKGQNFLDSVLLGRIGAPGLARRVALYPDAELERLIRHGVKRDGTGLFIMPTESLTHLSDGDVANVIGWLRGLRPAPDDYVEPMRFGPLARAALLGGGLHANVVLAPPPNRQRPADRGRYLATVACLQCHAMHESQPSESTDQTVPPLAEMAAAYDRPAFARLLRTGTGLAPRDLGAMREAAVEGLHDLSDEEIAAIHAYLAAEAAKPRPTP